MLWHDGSIKDAVDKVKLSDVILLVFIHGEDSLSEKYKTYLNNEAKFKAEEYVAVAIHHNSQEFQQFKQIYVSVPVPSIFVIDSNGKPLSVISSSETSQIFSILSNAIEKKKNFTKNSHSHLVANGNVTSNENNTRFEEKKKKHCHHVSNVGRKLFDVSEEEIKKRLKEIRAFPRFLHLDTPTSSGQDISLHPPTPKNQSARIQFRLPNNDMPSWEFPNLSTLGDIKAYLSEKMELTQNFKLLRNYPRTVFTTQDEKKTLTELNLIPNATLIVVPVHDVTVQAKIKSMIAQQSFASAMLKKLLEPVFIVLNYFKKYILRQKPEQNKISPKKFPSDTDAEKILNKKTSTSNIHGFKFHDDSDSDAENPDNGNSTQQRFQKKRK